MDPAFESKASRMDTFRGFEQDFAVPIEQLAAAGLFRAGTGDRTVCFASGCSLYNWDKDEKPLEEHRRWFPECKWAELYETDPDSVMCFEDCPAVGIVVELGYSMESIRHAYRKVGQNNPSAVSLLDAIFKKNSDKEEEEPKTMPQGTRRKSYRTSRQVDIRAAKANADECERLRKRLADLEKTFTCRSCGQNADMCSLPCGHIATCEGCVYKTSRCFACNTLVKGVVKTYRV